MFTNNHSLRHFLRPEHYCSEQQHELELEQLFRPAWQFVAVKSELAKDGDFLTLDLFGRPIIVRNSRGQFLAYENVCSHRHCLLTDAPYGNQPILKCQYHGWEFDDQGRTAKIPEAKCFRPWDRENSRLNMFRLESCGDLLFVCMKKEGPSLKDWLSPFFEETEQAFSAPMWKMGHVWDYDCECNWKVPAENTLESYHVTALHPKAFGDVLPPEENSSHFLTSRYTALTFAATSPMEKRQARLHEWLGGRPTNTYLHRHIHPNTILVSTDSFNYLVMYMPLTPRRVRLRMRMFGVRGTRRGPLASLFSWVAWRIAMRTCIQIFNEDRSIYDSQQKGLERSTHPGVIGIREERIFAFQKYILESLGLPIPADPMVSSEVSTAEISNDLP